MKHNTVEKLIEGCPLTVSSYTCPLFFIRNMSEEDRELYLSSISDKQASQLVHKHMNCYCQRSTDLENFKQEVFTKMKKEIEDENNQLRIISQKK